MWVSGDVVCRHIGATPQELAELVTAGLPHRNLPGGRREFTLNAVEAWLIAHDRIDTEGETIARTRAEAAQLLGLGIAGERTISKWLASPGFPGRSGTPGKRDGFFPIEKIQAWRAAMLAQLASGGPGGVAADPEIQETRHRLMLLEIQEQERRLRATLACQLNVDEVRKFHEFTVERSRRILARLPTDIADIVRDSIRGKLADQQCDSITESVQSRTSQRTSDALDEVALLLSGDDDHTTGGDDDE